MARSYPPRRFPAGPYLEPTVTPAMRGRKRTGPIGAIVPGDDIEVARELARTPPKPKREPVVYKVKLSGDTSNDVVLTTGTPITIFIDEDVDLMELIQARIGITTLSSDGDVVVQLRKSPAQTFDDEGLPEEDLPDEDMLIHDGEDDFRLRIDEGTYNSKDSIIQSEIDLEHSQLQFGDRISVDVDSAGTGVKGLEITLTFK